MHRCPARGAGGCLIDTAPGVWLQYGMPSSIKSTYSLDAPALATLQRLAQRWQVSKTEVLRRALRQAAEQEAISPAERIAALRSLQREMRAKKINFAAWKKTIRAGRR